MPGGLVGHWTNILVLAVLLDSGGEVIGFFDFLTPAAEGSGGDADDGGKVFPVCPCLGGIVDTLVFLVRGIGGVLVRFLVVFGLASWDEHCVLVESGHIVLPCEKE